MQRMKRMLAGVAALGVLLAAMLFGNRPVVHADGPTPTPSSGTTLNGGGGGGSVGK